MNYSIQELENQYNLELDKIIKTIKTEKPKSVLLQFPDGLKPYATSIANYLESKFPSILFKIWLGSCFGACDLPQTNEDLLIQFGHAPWK